MSVEGKHVTHRSPEIAELSRLLNDLRRALDPRRSVSSILRNENGVYMKLMNFRRFDPAFLDRGLGGLKRGNSLEQAIWHEFGQRHERLRKVAGALRAALVTSLTVTLPDPLDDEAEAVEGRLLTRLHRYRERDRKLGERKKASALKEFGRLSCEVCSFDFEERYGVRGTGFIECHHIRPLHTLTEPTDVHLSDLALLCANCHRMIHSEQPWLTLSELQAISS